MKEFVAWLNENIYWVFAVSVFGLVTGLFGVVTHYRGKRQKELSVYTDFNTLIENAKSNVPGMEILFEGKPVKSLETIIITVRNTGNMDISAEDTLEPLAFSIKTGEIFSVSLFEEDTKKSNGFLFDQNADQMTLRFRYMSPKDYARIQIMHTNPDNIVEVGWNGKIKDGKIANATKAERKKIGALSCILTVFLASVLIGSVSLAGAESWRWAIETEDSLFWLGFAGFTLVVSLLTTLFTVDNVIKIADWLASKLTRRK